MNQNDEQRFIDARRAVIARCYENLNPMQRQAVALLEPALTLPGGVYNFGSENAENMVLTARQFAETLGITVDIQEADWARNLAMDCSKLRAQGIVFDTTQTGLTRCLRDYGLR